MVYSELVSEEEGLRLAANYRVSCYMQGKPFTNDEVLLIVEQLAYARYLCGVFHMCMKGEVLLDLQGDQLVFNTATPEVSEKLKEEYGNIMLFRSMEEEENEL